MRGVWRGVRFAHYVARINIDPPTEVHGMAQVAVGRPFAERDLDNRQDIYAYDTLAWARYHAGDLHGAAQASEKALALGTKDPHLLYHAGMIAAATGNTDQARQLLSEALTINPNFDVLQAPRASETLRQLEGQP